MTVAVWDIETKGLAGELVIGEILHNGNAHLFRKWDHFFNLLRLLPDKTMIYAHNGGTYDNRYIFERATALGYKIKNKVVISGHVLFTLYLSKNKKIYFRDSILLLKSGLKQLCIDFDIEHKKKPFNMVNWINAGCPETEELKEYLHYDCLSLQEIMDIFTEEIGQPKMTIAGTAFNILMNTEFRGKPIKEWTKNYFKKEWEDLIRLGYFGGRVEVFIRECKRAFKYDVNSLYPFVMCEEYYPIGQHEYTEDPEKLKRSIVRYNHLAIAEVNVKLAEGVLDIPLLPVKDEGKLIFPFGEWSGWYTSAEIVKAIELGYEIEYIRGFSWRKKARIFEPFVSKYYEIKRTSKGSKKLMAKYLLNSSYGKFGQRREHREVMSLQEIIEKDLDIADFEYINDEILCRDTVSYRNRSINPVYAVFVTAYARLVLYRGIETVINLGGNVYYVDTDCIVSDVELPPEMVDNDLLGYWALEENIKEGVFVAPKLYKTLSIEGEHHIKAKGCTYGMREEIENIQIRHDSEYGHHFITVKTFDKFRKLLTEDGYDFKTKNKKVTGFFEHFRRLNTDKDRFIGVIETKKSITGKYNKRILTDNINTKPLYYRAA